jgi:RNA polymerase sigma-70 factor (ECF subfamily)
MRDEDFRQLYEANAQALFAYVAYRSGDRSLAEDVVATAFERAYRARRRFDPRKGSGRPWLYTIARNVLNDELRRREAERRAIERSEVDRPSPESDAVEARRDVWAALETLSEEERESIALRFGADLTVPEIARLLEQPLTTVEGRVYRALRKLRSKIDPQ